MYLVQAKPAIGNDSAEGGVMKLILILDAAPSGVQASLVEEWDELGATARMAPMIRHFDSDEEAIIWGRSLARRRGLAQIFLTDNRKTGPH
jgi:hypothetical protein